MILGCEGLANCHCGLQSLEVPVRSGNRWESSTHQFVTNSCKKLGPLRSKEWCQLGPLLSETTGTVSVDVRAKGLGDKEEVSSGSKESRIDSQEIVLHLVLPYSPCKDQAELEFYKTQKKPVRICNSCAIEVDVSPQLSFISDGFELNAMVSHDLLCQQNLAHSDSAVFVELPVAHENFDGGLDAVSESASAAQEMVETASGLEMLKPPVKDGVDHMFVTGEKEGKESLDGQELQKSSPEQPQVLSRGDLPGTIEDSDAKMPSNLGTHGLRSLIETDTVQKFKRRRLSTPVDVSLVKDMSLQSETELPVDGEDRPKGQLKSINIVCQVLCAPPRTDEDVVLSKSSVQKAIPDGDVDKDSIESGDFISKNRCGEALKESGDVRDRNDSPSADGSGGSSIEGETVDHCTISLPKPVELLPEGHGPRRREWLAQHHGDVVEDTTAQNAHNAGFAGFVGGLYRYAIDNRPPAPHPGTVGDMISVQFCKVCGGSEDSNNSLICDECEQVYHMTCINSRMKIVPRVDEWYCRQCKRMKKHGESCGQFEPGAENKGWWRDDAGIGKVEKELMKMSNGKRTKVRIGPKFQAVVPEWNGVVEEVDLDDTLAETSHVFGQEVALSAQDKQREQEIAEYNLAENIWPKGWLPATKLPPNVRENWLQCTVLLWEEGETRPDGTKAETDIFCGKWRRAPLNVEHNDSWECSCALVWDPRHADCAVPQELTDEEIQERIKLSAQLEREAPPA